MWRLLLIILIIVILYLVLQYSEETDELKIESFASVVPKIQTCPPDTISYIKKDGSQECCEGTVIDKKCSGKVVCSVTSAKNGIPTCTEYIDTLFKQRTQQFCPTNMYNYYDNWKGSRGCSNQISADRSSGVGVNKCKIYKTEEDDLKYKDSCYLLKKLSDTRCPTGEANKVLIPLGNEKDPFSYLYSCNFKDTHGLPRTCYDIESSTRDGYNAGINPKKNPHNESRQYLKDWGYKGILKLFDDHWGMRRHVLNCDVAKKYYIDKTMSDRDIIK